MNIKGVILILALGLSSFFLIQYHSHDESSHKEVIDLESKSMGRCMHALFPFDAWVFYLNLTDNSEPSRTMIFLKDGALYELQTELLPQNVEEKINSGKFGFLVFHVVHNNIVYYFSVGGPAKERFHPQSLIEEYYKSTSEELRLGNLGKAVVYQDWTSDLRSALKRSLVPHYERVFNKNNSSDQNLPMILSSCGQVFNKSEMKILSDFNAILKVSDDQRFSARKNYMPDDGDALALVSEGGSMFFLENIMRYGLVFDKPVVLDKYSDQYAMCHSDYNFQFVGLVKNEVLLHGGRCLGTLSRSKMTGFRLKRL